ncbi:hypothetical protein [Lactococcus muris]|uniref:hypothetical protein n=1 Tax=Lactococcus muris TaxID=2941330 RepID=UPI00203B11EA|nr:hypothetical protein [Lactococcus muris]
MLKLFYSKIPQYCLASDGKKYYLVDSDSDLFSRYIIFPNKFSQKVYEIDEKKYEALLKNVDTIGSKGISVINISAITLPFASILYIIFKIVPVQLIEENYFFALGASIVMAFVSYKIMNLFFKHRNIIFLNSLKSREKLVLKNLDSIKTRKIWINNFLQISLFLLLPLFISAKEHNFLSILLIYCGFMMFQIQHRMFFIRALSLGLSFSIEREKDYK